MPKKPVTVICDFTGTFNDGWTGAQPAWTVEPESLKCRKGNHSIVWSLTAENVPKGFDAAFADPGIVFKPMPRWPGGTPHNKPNGNVTASNNFPGSAKSVKYNYTVFVTAAPDPGAPFPSQTFSVDPDVENEGGGGPTTGGKPKKRKKARASAKPKPKAKARPKAKKAKKAKKKAGKKR